MTAPPDTLSARDNPTLVLVRKLLAQPAAYRRQGQLWLEGDHLLQAALQRGWPLAHVLLPLAQAGDGTLLPLRYAARRCSLVSDALWQEACGQQSPPRIGALVALPAAAAVQPGVATVVLAGLQDTGNVGSILRSAAALGVAQVLALAGTAALWSPKVLRAAMGAHFALNLVEQGAQADLAALQVPLVATSSHGGALLPQAVLPQPCAWLFGHEGQGLQDELSARCTHTVRIPQPGGEESLNVAAAAAICLYEALRQRQ